jgi:maleate isomerase
VVVVTLDERLLPAAGERNPVLAEIVERLRLATGAARTTIRGPVPGQATTSSLLAEALATGVRSMATAPPAGIEEAETYTYLRSRRRNLIQPDCTEEPRPPASLINVFHVTAQMLGPLLDGDRLVGTVSVHHEGGPRAWSAAEVDALDRAVAEVRRQWGLA